MNLNISCRDCDFDKNIDLSSKTATSTTVGNQVCQHLINYPAHRVEVMKIYATAPPREQGT